MPQGKKPSQIDQIVADASARLLDEEADRQRVPREFARKIAGIESSGRADVISGQRQSSAGAIGKMQLMPGTARDLGVDPNHLEQNVQGGVKYLRQQLDTFGGDQRKAAAAYNAGPAAVRKYGGVPPYAETQKYANQFPSGGESNIDRIVRGVSAQTPVSTASESEPSTLRKVSAPGRQKTTVRGPMRPSAPNPFALNQPTGFEQAGQQVAARTSQISPEVATQADQRGRELTRFQGRSRLGQLGEVAAGGLMQGVDQMVKAASYLNPSPLAPRGYGLIRPDAARNLEAQIAAQDVALPNTAPIVRGTVAAASQLPAIALAGPAAPVVAGGLAASNADWRDPKRAALQTGVGLLGGAAGGQLAQMAIRPATMAGRLASGTVGGAAGNVLPTAVEQLAYEGKLNLQQLAQQAVIGGATGAALPPGVSPRPRARRPQSPIDVPVYDDTGEITGYDRINAPLTPDVVGQGVNRAGDLGATGTRRGILREPNADVRVRPRGTAPMPIQNRLASLTPTPDAPATTAMPPLDPTQIPAQSNPLAILNANANEAKINAAQFEAAGDWESARREYDVAHKSLVAAQRQMGRPKTGEEADALTAVQREISAAAGNRDRARRAMMAAGRVAAKQQKAVEDAPTTEIPKVSEPAPDTSPLLQSVVNPEGGIPTDRELPNRSGMFGQLARRQEVEQAKPVRGPKDSGQLSAAEYLKRATDGEGVRVSDRGEARVLGAKEAGIVGLTNRASRFTTSDAQVMLDEGGFSLPDGRKFTDPSVTENDVLAFLAESGREGRMNTRDLDQRIEQEAADYYANQPTGDLPERTAPLTEGVSRGMARAPRIGQMPPSGRFAPPETPAQRPQTVAEQARQAGDVTDDLALIDQLNRRLAVEEPRPYGERTRSGEPGTALSYSPYNDLVTNNRGAIAQLRQMDVDSPEAGEIIARIDDFAERRGIEPRHVENMLNYIRNEQVEQARLEDQGIGSAPLRQTPTAELQDFYSRPDEAPPRSEPLRPVRTARPTEAAPVEPELRPADRGNIADTIAEDLRRLHAMNPQEIEQTLREAEVRRNDDIRDPQMNEVERRMNRDLLKFANERRHEMVRAKQLPAKSPRGPARGERPTAKEAASIKNPLEQDVTILSDEDLAKRIRDAERILNAPELSQDRRRKVDGFLNRAKQEQGKRTPDASPETPRTVSHPDPAIDGKPILAETADGRVIVPNEENKSGVSVVKPDRKSIKYAIPEEAMPELNSNRERGAKTRADVENSPEFKRWFGDSKVVDDQGKPLVVYHGTWRDYDAFNADAAQDASRSADSAFGFHFGTSGQAESRIYRGEGKNLTRTDITRNMGRADSQNRAKTMPVYLQLRNPLRMEDAGAWEGRPLIKALNDAGVHGDFAERSPREIARMIQDMGYDGIVYQNVGEMDLDANGNFKDSYIAFRPEQIKSATGNRGTFDPSDPNMTRQRGNQPPPMPDRVTARDLADNVRAEYRPAANRPGTVYLNDWGLEALNAADYLEFRAGREGAADDRITGGVNYPPEEARQIADHIRERAGRPNFNDEGRKNLETMARQIEMAADDGNVSFVPMKGQALGQAKATIRHEAFHSQQSAIHPDVHELTTPRWLRAQKFGAAIGEELSRRGYSDRQHPAEAAAFVASGNWDMFGMSRDDAKAFLTEYFDNVAYRHGKEAINKFRAIHPALQEVVEARRGTNEPRFGSPGLGRSAEPAINRQRGIERPGGVAARSRGGVPSGNAGAVRGQSPTAALRAITPASIRAQSGAGQQAQPAPAQSPQRQGLGAITAASVRATPAASPTSAGAGGQPPQGRFAKGMEFLSDLYHAPKSLLSSADISAAGRQGLFLSLPPSQWGRAAKATGRQFKSLVSTPAYDRFVGELRGHRDYQTAKDSGLYLATDETSTGINGREEGFASKLIGKLPHVKYSEQAYKTYLDSIRMDTFEKYNRLIESQRGSSEQKETAKKAAADWINTSTGRGKIHGKFGESVEAATPLLNAIFFAPRYTISRFQMINPVTYARNLQSPQHRVVFRQQASDVFQTAAALVATGALAKAAGASVSFDPEEADFLKLKFGNTRYDVLAGTQQVARLALRIGDWMKAEGMEDSEKRLAAKRRDTAEVVKRFGRTKLAPVPSFFMDWLSNWKNVAGEQHKPSEWSVKNPIVQRALPLLWSDVLEGYERGYRGEGVKGGVKTAARFAPAAVGIGVQDYERKKKQPARVSAP